MTFGDTLDLAFRNLRQAKLRTALTTLGVSIGIASLAGMVSLGVGLQDQILGRFLRSGVFGTITVTDASDLPGALAQLGRRGGPLRGNRTAAPAVPAAKLDSDAVQRLAQIQNVRDVYPNLRLPVEMTMGEFSRISSAVGVPMSSKDEGAYQTFSYGGFFHSDSESACLISLDLAKQMDAANPSGLIGKNLTLTYAASRSNDGGAILPGGVQVQRVNLSLPIAGIVERDTGGLGPGGGGLIPLSGIVIPIGLAKTIDAEIVTNAQSLLRDVTQPKAYTAVTVKVNQPQFTQDVEDRIRGMGYTAFSVDDALRGAKNAFILLNIFLSLIGSIALAVSSLGIVNTMVMSILERTREIGIMKAIGASDSDIRRIFLIEASVIGLLGGVVGIGLGWAVGQVINFGANIYIRTQGGTPGRSALPIWLIASAIAFSIAISLAAGSYPAARAAKLDPIQALRHD